jgi:acetylglutamate kinase
MTADHIHRAREQAVTLAGALPWLRRFHGATVVVKFGGNAMVDADLTAAFAEDIVFLRLAGLRPVVVHGGGPQINAMLDQLGIESEFRGGLRVTTPEVMRVVEMVLTGQVQREIVRDINEHGPLAVGMSGEDGGVLNGVRRMATVDGQQVDVGLVGEITEVRAEPIFALLDQGLIPVISTVAKGVQGETLNVNADTAAGAVAVALAAEKLVMLTDVEGLYRDWPSSDEVIEALTTDELRAMLPTLSSGMIPKMEACLRAVDAGVKRAHVIDGRVPHSLLVEVFTDQGVGTMVVSDRRPNGNRS